MNQSSKQLIAALGGVVIIAGLLYWVHPWRHSQREDSPEPELQSLPQPIMEQHVVPRGDTESYGTTVREVSDSSNTAPSSVRKLAPAPAMPAPVEGSTAMAEESLAKLIQINPAQGALTHEQAAQINAWLRQLREQGAAAVPAIRKFLESNQDVNFDGIEGGSQVDVPTLRLGLIDALQQIGGTEAVQLSVEALQATANPLEIAVLAQSLEQLAPGQYRPVELTAASKTLELASSGQWTGGDVSPLFELMQHYGDATVVPVLEQSAAKWNYYATLALAGMPNGTGIPGLIALAQDPNISSLGTGDFALRPLAQAVLQYPEAGQALVNLARQNQIPATAWPTVISSLSGSYIQYGNGLFGSTALPMSSSPAEISQRVTFLNQMMTATSDTSARQLLQNAITSLSAKLPR
jgi:hypothetical protein